MTSRPTYLSNIDHQPSSFDKGSRIVYGAAGLGGVWGKVDEEESIECLLYAFENGISSVDTSPSYSRSEEFVGKALKRWSGERPFLSTKVGRLPAEKADECYVDYSPESLRRSLMTSLEKLGVGQLDLLFLHEPHLVPLDHIDEILDTLRSFKGEGYTRMLGVGGNPTDEFRLYATHDNFQVISGYLKMDACNLSAFEKDMPHILSHNLTYYSASPLHMSLLGNRFDRYTADPPNTEWITQIDVDCALATHQIATNHGLKLSTLAHRYLFSTKEASRVVIGARKIDQIESTVADWKAATLPQAIYDQVTNKIIEIRGG